MFKNFKFKLIIYLVGIFLVTSALGISWYQSGFNIYMMILIPTLIGLVWQMYVLIDRTNTEVANFLANIKYNDYAVTYSERNELAHSYQELHGAFNLVTKKFQDIRSEKEAQYQYLQAIVENVDTGLICFDADGKTILINKGLQTILHKSYFSNFESIRKYDESLYEAMDNINPGEKKLVKIILAGQLVQLAIRKTILKLREDELHLYAIQNIHAELEEQELDSWQKLIRILTHEIMNSVSPILSLAGTTNEMLKNGHDLDEEDTEDIKKAIQAIHRRSEGLLHFTETYRQLTKVPQPKFLDVDPIDLIDQILVLLQPKMEKHQVQVQKKYPANTITAYLDPDLMEQVLINLINNAIDAMENTENPQLQINVFRSLEGELEIQIADNGPGIPEELQEQIFVPFFTTKEKGSGIGLSLSRQIIQMHKGSLYAYSRPGKGTVFTIRM